MARPLRLEFGGALYHVTSRGDRREDIYFSDEDRVDWLTGLGIVCARFNWVVYAFCQMSNHYHLLVETVDGNLSGGMRQLNGQYTQRFNRRHGMVGHLFQGRYKALLVEKESYLLELSRYVVLNPLRANMVESLADWPWSSYALMFSQAGTPPWLNSDGLLGYFGTQREQALQAYQAFIMQGKGLPSPLLHTRNQMLLGEKMFVDQHKLAQRETLRELSKAHRKALALSLDAYRAHNPDRDQAMAAAYHSGAYTMAEIGHHFGVHYMTVSRAVKKVENKEVW